MVVNHGVLASGEGVVVHGKSFLVTSRSELQSSEGILSPNLDAVIEMFSGEVERHRVNVECFRRADHVSKLDVREEQLSLLDIGHDLIEVLNIECSHTVFE